MTLFRPVRLTVSVFWSGRYSTDDNKTATARADQRRHKKQLDGLEFDK
jgi:hypothetical protein